MTKCPQTRCSRRICNKLGYEENIVKYVQVAWQRNRTEFHNAGEENIHFWNCQLSSYWVLESSCFLAGCSCFSNPVDVQCQEWKLNCWGEREGWVTVTKERGSTGQESRTDCSAVPGKRNRKKTDSSPNRRGENWWKVLREGVKWKEKVATSDINVAVRADDGTSLWASVTGSGCFKASFLAGAPLLKSLYTYTQLCEWSVFKCINFLCLGFSRMPT